jgi:hypothetical protein
MFFLIINVALIQASLGMGPAIIEVDYEPGLKFEVKYHSVTDDSNNSLFIFADGDFKEYVKFDKTKIVGSDTFTAFIELPNSVEIYGKRKLFITVAEENKIQDGKGLSTLLRVGALIQIKVPYPDKYAEIKTLDVNFANPGDPIAILLAVENLGTGELTPDASIVIRNEQEEILDTFILDKVLIPSLGINYYTKNKDTGYGSGTYNVTAIVNYGKEIRDSRILRVGELFIDIVSISNESLIGKINNFDLTIRSFWNNKLEEVYAEVQVYSSNMTLVDSFKTPSVDLYPWSDTYLKGYFNAEKLELGEYDANVTLHYRDKVLQRRATTNKLTKIFVVNPPIEEPKGLTISPVMLIGIIMGAIIIFLIAVIIFLFIGKKGEKNVKNKKKL